MDHNEKKQAIDDIEEAVVQEIVDHHRFGGFQSDNPISITTSPIGATASIVAGMFLDDKEKMPKELAGILLGAIVSDTMNFKSPTTTDTDIQIARQLEKISKVDHNELSRSMIEHAESILDKRFIEVVYNDFKEFNIDGNRVGLAQAVCKTRDEYLKLKDNLQKYLDDSCKSGGYDLLVVMLTLANGSGSYLLASGDKKSLIKETFLSDTKDNFVSGLVSRKKQLLPGVIEGLENR